MISKIEISQEGITMGYITFISETGIPHSACLIEISEGGRHCKRWWGFQPPEGFFGGARSLDTRDRTHLINHYVRFKLDDKMLSKLEFDMQFEWLGKGYGAPLQDCVSFTAWVARKAGLITTLANFTPYGLVFSLRELNPPEFDRYDEKPYPWL